MDDPAPLVLFCAPRLKKPVLGANGGSHASCPVLRRGYKRSLSRHQKRQSETYTDSERICYLCTTNRIQSHTLNSRRLWQRNGVVPYAVTFTKVPRHPAVPMCKVGKEKFVELVEAEGDLDFVTVHKIGDGKGASKELWEGLRESFHGRVRKGGHVSGYEPSGRPRGLSEIARLQASVTPGRGRARLEKEFAEAIGEYPGTPDQPRKAHERRVRRLRGQDAPGPHGEGGEPRRRSTPFTRWPRTRPVTAKGFESLQTLL